MSAVMPAVAPEASTPQRILIAEDSEVTQELLKLLLTEQGHTVDLASDGVEALEALQRNDYDVVLMDFHLPRLDGLQVASAYRVGGGRAGRPRFVAITADAKGLLAHAADCETFDQILAKPLDISQIGRIVAGRADSRAEPGSPIAPATGRAGGRQHEESGTPPAAEPRPAASPLAAIGHRLLDWPQDRGRLRSLRGDSAPDAVVVRAAASGDELAELWQHGPLHALPIIDLTGSLGVLADLSAAADGGEPQAAEAVIRRFKAGRDRIHPDLLSSEDLGEKLLVRLSVSGKSLTAAYDPGRPGAVRYNVTLDPATVEKEADGLHASGFLARDFFDRLAVCDRCGSSRFNVREECPECGSPHLSEEAYLHHFKCAYQGAESDFRQGDDLVCPKCRKALAHYSIDYDKPGVMVKCQRCRHATSDPTVGFVCLDCSIHSAADAVRTRDVYCYRVAERALAFLESGRALLGHRQRALRFAELPLELIVALNGALKRHETDGRPFALLDISYRNRRAVESEHGARQFDRSRALLVETLRQILRKDDRVVPGREYDFALLEGVAPEEAREAAASLVEEASQPLQLDLGVAIDVFGPEDFA